MRHTLQHSLLLTIPQKKEDGMKVKKLTVLVLLGLFALIQSGCDLPENCGDTELIELTLEDSGQVIKMDLDDQIAVKLQGHASEGYEWINESPEGNIIVQHGEPDVDCPPDLAPGGSCLLTYYFDAVEAGVGEINLTCKRPWLDPEYPDPIHIFKVKVIVSET